MIHTINVSVNPDQCTGYHQRIEYDPAEGVLHDYRLGCSDSSVGVHESEPADPEKWDRMCQGFTQQMRTLRQRFPEALLHLDIDGETVV